ncbi:HNH endonuclease signature motif containing protein [Lachnoclostridium sp.]|uniref:HNH endonuclease n=1 Tax=Lachnoclostridium sp. TaxID=2028282 RepID=UPI00289EFB7E|nr:HNH endonuclease signature motif containing protein [Lachnoclostridium sp.]
MTIEVKRKAIPKATRLKVYEKCNGHCAYCGCELEYKDMQVEHVKPLSICGADQIENMLPACRSCNHYKSTLDLEGFRKYLSGLHKRMLRDNVNYRTLNRFKLIEQNTQQIQFYFEQIGVNIERSRNNE